MFSVFDDYFCAGPTSTTASFHARLQPGVAFQAGETLSILGVDPAAVVTTPFPQFFSVVNQGGTVIMTALVNGVSGTAPVLQFNTGYPELACCMCNDSAQLPYCARQFLIIPGPGAPCEYIPPTPLPSGWYDRVAAGPSYTPPPGPPVLAAS